MAEINFNNLYNQLTPMEQDQYDGVFGSSGFKDKYAQESRFSFSYTKL
jgi:hypothetical protein